MSAPPVYRQSIACTDMIPLACKSIRSTRPVATEMTSSSIRVSPSRSLLAGYEPGDFGSIGRPARMAVGPELGVPLVHVIERNEVPGPGAVAVLHDREVEHPAVLVATLVVDNLFAIGREARHRCYRA